MINLKPMPAYNISTNIQRISRLRQPEINVFKPVSYKKETFVTRTQCTEQLISKQFRITHLNVGYLLKIREKLFDQPAAKR
jgi:hypothetical protein